MEVGCGEIPSAEHNGATREEKSDLLIGEAGDDHLVTINSDDCNHNNINDENVELIKKQQTEYLERQNCRAEQLKEMIRNGIDIVLVAISPHVKPGGHSSDDLRKMMLEGCHRYLNPGESL